MTMYLYLVKKPFSLGVWYVWYRHRVVLLLTVHCNCVVLYYNVQPASRPWSSPPKSHLNRSIAAANVSANSPAFIGSCARSESLRSRWVCCLLREVHL